MGQSEDGGDVPKAESVTHERLRGSTCQLSSAFGSSSGTQPGLPGRVDHIAGGLGQLDLVDDLGVQVAVLEDGGADLLLDGAQTAPGGVNVR